MKHHIVVGLGFGDEGKGTTTEYLARENKAVATIRFNGGQQAAHNVVHDDGAHHTFAQFGAATLDGVPSYLSRFCTVEPFALYSEAEHLHSLTGTNPYELLGVSENALLTTPLHAIVNRERERARGKGIHGSVGVGFGETIQYSLEHPLEAPRASDLRKPSALLKKLSQYHQRALEQGFNIPLSQAQLTEMRDALVITADLVDLVTDEQILEKIQSGSVVFEGAQGFLLDEWYGFHPHTTWSTTTPANARTLLAEAGELGQEEVIGINRSYHTRHGAGPFPSEGMYKDAPREMHNGSDGVQGAWRNGAFDLTLFQYALDVVKPDKIALTFADKLAPVVQGSNAIVPPTSWVEEIRLKEQQEIGEKTMMDARTPVDITSCQDFQKLVMEMAGAQELLVSVSPTVSGKSWIR